MQSSFKGPLFANHFNWSSVLSHECWCGKTASQHWRLWDLVFGVVCIHLFFCFFVFQKHGDLSYDDISTKKNLSHFTTRCFRVISNSFGTCPPQSRNAVLSLAILAAWLVPTNAQCVSDSLQMPAWLTATYSKQRFSEKTQDNKSLLSKPGGQTLHQWYLRAVGLKDQGFWFLGSEAKNHALAVLDWHLPASTPCTCSCS